MTTLNDAPSKDPPGALMALCFAVLFGGIAGHMLAVWRMPNPPVDWVIWVEMVPETWPWWIAGEALAAGAVWMFFRNKRLSA